MVWGIKNTFLILIGAIVLISSLLLYTYQIQYFGPEIRYKNYWLHPLNQNVVYAEEEKEISGYVVRFYNQDDRNYLQYLSDSDSNYKYFELPNKSINDQIFLAIKQLDGTYQNTIIQKNDLFMDNFDTPEEEASTLRSKYQGYRFVITEVRSSQFVLGDQYIKSFNLKN